MNSTPKSDEKYVKLEVDNAQCQRRFHIGYERDSPLCKGVKVRCPHCNITILKENNHPPCFLLREENLVDYPDGSRKIVSQCNFLNTKL